MFIDINNHNKPMHQHKMIKDSIDQGDIKILNLYASIKNFYFCLLKFYETHEYKPHWLSEPGDSVAHPVGGCHQMWGTGCVHKLLPGRHSWLGLIIGSSWKGKAWEPFADFPSVGKIALGPTSRCGFSLIPWGNSGMWMATPLSHLNRRN